MFTVDNASTLGLCLFAQIYMSTRFQDQNYTLQDFKKEIHIYCPECSKQAVIRNDEEHHKLYIACGSCSFWRTEETRVMELHFSACCNTCGEKITYSKKVPDKQDHVIIRCPSCKTSHTFTPKVSEYYSVDQVLDKYTFWYSENFKGNQLWAYNREHLEYIERYVEANLRERHNRKYGTMVEKLPNFIKSAKNRDDLLKLIKVMKQR